MNGISPRVTSLFYGVIDEPFQFVNVAQQYSPFASRVGPKLDRLLGEGKGGGGFVCQGARDTAYILNLRRNIPARLTSPVPTRVRDPGSGTVVTEILVLPLEIVAVPLKNPLPTGTVS